MSELEAKRVRDRIGALPDVVLCHILSFLSTEEAVTTCILSKRWKKLWAYVPNLDFTDEYRSESVFISRFVDNVLFLRNSSDIHKFRLHTTCVEDFSRICSWIGAAIGRNVVELDLIVEDYAGDEDHPRVFELPESIFTSKTLRVLKLSSNFIINPPASGCFPSLKSLCVRISGHINKSVEKLFTCCPVLENLRIARNGMQRGDPFMNFIISAPELKKLKLYINWTSDDIYLKCCKFYINAPKLENFHLYQDSYTDSDCFLENAKSLVRVTITLHDYAHPADTDHRFAIPRTALLAGISSVKNLYLSAHHMKGCCLPVFVKLSRLELILYRCYYWEFLKELLKKSRNLDYLVIELNECKCGESSDQEWSPPESVPTCLMSQIKTISIMGFKGNLDEMEAAKYLLENGEVLKKMTIYYNDRVCTEKQLHMEFSMFRWGSKGCLVEFFPDMRKIGLATFGYF